jgi:hypothetical protein
MTGFRFPNVSSSMYLSSIRFGAAAQSVRTPPVTSIDPPVANSNRCWSSAASRKVRDAPRSWPARLAQIAG